MRILLLQLDGSLPNLALMRIAAHHRAAGDDVELVRHERAWTTSFGDLPHDNGEVSEATQLVACVARGLLPLAGANGVRDALSFWAVESDPAVWQSIALG